MTTRMAVRSAGLLLAGLLAFANLEAWPLIWFDEGIHLHVPKALVRFGVYADYSSEGFRHYGPTMSVGPTVMLPIAAAFATAGVSLLAARVIMASYFVLAVTGVFLLARRLGGERIAWAGTALIVSSIGVDLLYLGRQVLGEVPALTFTAAGLLAWFAAWDRPSHARLAAAGLLFGLAVVTKSQFLILLVPGLALAWIVNRAGRPVLPDRVFLWPLVLTFLSLAAWQAAALLYLGPSTVGENLALLRRATAGAALGFSLENVRRAAAATVSFWLYGGLLLPALVHAGVCALDRSREGFRWTAILCLVLPALAWFLVASIGWPRYGFPAYVLGGLLVARLFADLTDGFRLPRLRLRVGSDTHERSSAVAVAAWVLLAVIICVPLARRTVTIVHPPENFPRLVADYLEQHVPHGRIVETWEPELGFLTDHRYHFPPAALLIDAVAHRFAKGPSPGETYDFREDGPPDYLVRGAFAAWVGVYPEERVQDVYEPMTTIGPYAIYQRRLTADETPASPR